MSLNNATEKDDTSIDKKTVLESPVVIYETPSKKYANSFSPLSKYFVYSYFFLCRRKTSIDVSHKPTVLTSPLKAYNASKKNKNTKSTGLIGLPIQSPQTPASVINEPQTPKQLNNIDDDNGEFNIKYKCLFSLLLLLSRSSVLPHV